MTNVTEIKKTLYKEKPVARSIRNYKNSRIYEAETSMGNIIFDVPYSEMGENKFIAEVPAQLLIRWMVNGK